MKSKNNGLSVKYFNTKKLTDLRKMYTYTQQTRRTTNNIVHQLSKQQNNVTTYINNDKYVNTLLRVYYQFDITL